MSGHPIPDDTPGNYGHNRHRLDCEQDPRAEEWRDLIEYAPDVAPDAPRWTQAEIARAKVDAERLYAILNNTEEAAQ